MGAFIEYTVKPLLDDAHELLKDFKDVGLDVNDMTWFLMKLYIFERVMSFMTQVVIAGIICFTALRFLSTIQ